MSSPGSVGRGLALNGSALWLRALATPSKLFSSLAASAHEAFIVVLAATQFEKNRIHGRWERLLGAKLLANAYIRALSPAQHVQLSHSQPGPATRLVRTGFDSRTKAARFRPRVYLSAHGELTELIWTCGQTSSRNKSGPASGASTGAASATARSLPFFRGSAYLLNKRQITSSAVRTSGFSLFLTNAAR